MQDCIAYARRCLLYFWVSLVDAVVRVHFSPLFFSCLCLCACVSLSSPRGSDCGIVNVNVGTSGAEIGGAFGEHVAASEVVRIAVHDLFSV